MKIQMNLQRGLLSVVLGFAIALASQAAEIHVITSGAFATAFEELAPLYEKQSSHTVKISYGSSMGAAPDAIPARLSRNEKVDILMLAGPALDGFIKKGAVADGTRVDLANSTIGAVVKKGAPKPDISTVAALKTALLQAKSIAYSASASGTYLSTELFVKLGVAEQLKDTAKKIYSQAVFPVKSFAQKTFTPDLGRKIAKVAIHDALPAVVSGLASSATTALTGNPYAGYAVGQTAGKYAGKQAGDSLGRTVGLGLKRGSLEAKHKMAELRALRKKK